MMTQHSLKWAFLGLFGLGLVACGGGDTSSNGQPPKADTLDTSAAHTQGNLMKVGGKLFSIPSPVQTALLIHKLGLPYQKDLPLAQDATEKLATKAQRAVALGAYGADLAYVTVHKDGQRALSTLVTIEKLSGQLDLTNAFDQSLMEKFKKSLSNEDSLLRFSGTAFRAADQYLKQNERNDVSALVLAGGWIESMYLTMSGPADKPAAEIVSRVGEQRKTLDNLVALVEGADTDHASAQLITGLKDLQGAFNAVNAAYQFQQPTVDASHKITYINSTTSITMSPEQYKAIGEKVRSLRSMIIA